MGAQCREGSALLGRKPHFLPPRTCCSLNSTPEAGSPGTGGFKRRAWHSVIPEALCPGPRCAGERRAEGSCWCPPLVSARGASSGCRVSSPRWRDAWPGAPGWGSIRAG